MITKALIDALLASLDAIFGLLPSFSLTFPATDGIFAIVGQANNVFPVMTLITLLGLWWTVLLGLRLWDFCVFVLHQFWGSD